MKKFKLTEGPFAGKKIIFETDGTDETVYCPICGRILRLIFFIKDYTEKDINRECPECGNLNLKFKKKEEKEDNVK
jgi:endogenous inhibitor of DNA gyrase (YacG/DUF329 family)